MNRTDNSIPLRRGQAHHVATSRALAGPAGVARPHDEIGQPIPVDVTGTRDAAARPVAHIDAVDHKAPTAGGDGGEVHRRPVGLAEDHVALTRAVDVARVGEECPHDDVRQAVAVDVTGT